MNMLSLLKKKISVIHQVLCFAIAIVNSSTNTFAQQNILSENFQTQFKSYQDQFPQEKIFIHTDKSFYVPGELIWFKIYDVDAMNHVPFSISKVAYIEVLNDQHSAISQIKISMEKGFGEGSLQIPTSIGSGIFVIRGYTNWMKNFDPDFYFEKPICIVNPSKYKEADIRNDSVEYTVQFFPEGGNLVVGLQSKVAFEVTNK